MAVKGCVRGAFQAANQSRLVNALDSAPTIFSWWRPAAPQRLWHLGRATHVITLNFARVNRAFRPRSNRTRLS